MARLFSGRLERDLGSLCAKCRCRRVGEERCQYGDAAARRPYSGDSRPECRGSRKASRLRTQVCSARETRANNPLCYIIRLRLSSTRWRNQLRLQVRGEATHFKNPADRVGKFWEGILPVSVKDQRLG